MATRFLKILSNGNKILKSKLMTAPSFMIIFNFSFPFFIEILKVATASTPLTSDVNLEEIASKTTGFSGADLDNICKEATLEAMTKAGLDKVESVDKADFDLIMKKFTICNN